jgi:hypothetical protein
MPLLGLLRGLGIGSLGVLGCLGLLAITAVFFAISALFWGWLLGLVLWNHVVIHWIYAAPQVHAHLLTGHQWWLVGAIASLVLRLATHNG